VDARQRRWLARIFGRSFKAYLRRRNNEPERIRQSLRRNYATSHDKRKQRPEKAHDAPRTDWRMRRYLYGCIVCGSSEAFPRNMICFCVAQRLALPAGGRDEVTPFWRNQLQATQTAWKRAESHQSGARCVGRTLGTPTLLIDRKKQTHLDTILPTMKTLAITKKDSDQTKTWTKQNHRQSKNSILWRNRTETRNLGEMMQNLCYRKQIESTSLIKPKLNLASEKRLDQ